MTVVRNSQREGLSSADAWAWWQARRRRYNLALAAAGWAAYGLNAALFYALGHPIWRDWRGALSMTLFLGIVFLVAMGVANVFYLLGPGLEAGVKPSEVARYRRAAFAMGFWGSVALPFVFPAINLAILVGGGS
jgi:hypothetical protein